MYRYLVCTLTLLLVCMHMFIILCMTVYCVSDRRCYVPCLCISVNLLGLFQPVVLLTCLLVSCVCVCVCMKSLNKYCIISVSLVCVCVYSAGNTWNTENTELEHSQNNYPIGNTSTFPVSLASLSPVRQFSFGTRA